MSAAGVKSEGQFEFQADFAAWERVRERIERELSPAQQKRLLDELAVIGHRATVEQMLARSHSHKTGVTEKWTILSSGDDAREIRAMSMVPTYLEWGTRDHGPVTSDFLYFENADGQLIRTKHVRGIEAQHNVDRLVLPAVQKAALERINQVLQRVANG